MRIGHWCSNLSDLSKRWEAKNEPSMFTKFKEAVRSPDPLKSRLEMAMRRIDVQIQKLDQTSNRFSERDKSLFNTLVDAYEKHDMTKTNILANELAEVRKMEKLTLQARMALEQIGLRLQTVTELGNIAVVLAPLIGVVQNVKTSLAGISPEVARELGDIGGLLSGIALDAGSISGMSINFESTTEDSAKILSEAATIAEQRMKTKFPELPSISEKLDEKVNP